MKLRTSAGAKRRQPPKVTRVRGTERHRDNGPEMFSVNTDKNAYRSVARHFEQSIGTALTFKRKRGRR